MGILDRIFKSLWGKGDTAAAKPAASVSEEISPSRPQSYRASPEPHTEPAAAAYAERPIEYSVSAPQPASRPAPLVQAEPEEPRESELQYSQQAAAYEPQPNENEVYEQQQVYIRQMESYEIADNEAGDFEPPELAPDLDPGRTMPLNDLSESMQSSMPQASESNFFADVVDDFDEAFDAAFSSEGGSDMAVSEGQIEHDEAAIQDLFANIAANYARPVKNFIFELKCGTATKEWIEICRPAMRSISRAAESMNLSIAAKSMSDFDEALQLALVSEDRILGGEIRELILSSYEDLIYVLPQTFVIGKEEQQREGTIINSLLKQIPDLGRVTFEKLYGAGLTSLDTLFLAKKEDLAAATGIPLWLCERICNKFYQYREELEGTPRDVAQSGHRQRLAELTAYLRRFHEGFEKASAEEWSNPSLALEKRKFRQNRQACVLQINIVLAEMGELDLVNEIQKLSFERRIQRLEEYLANLPGTF